MKNINGRIEDILKEEEIKEESNYKDAYKDRHWDSYNDSNYHDKYRDEYRDYGDSSSYHDHYKDGYTEAE